mgnify:FL=1
MFLYLIESFDLFWSPVISKDAGMLLSPLVNLINSTFGFYKLRFLIFIILAYAITIFYINLKNKNNTILINSFLNGFNENMKGTLFFKKINFLN